MADNRTRYAILGALTIAPMSGYDLKRFMDRSVTHFWAESYGQIYPILKQLYAERLVTGATQPGEKRRARTVYTITSRGRTALRRWLAEPAQPQVRRIELLLKIFFAGSAGSRAAVGLVRDFRAAQAAELEQLRTTAAALRAEHGKSASLRYWLITLDYGEQVTRAMIAWADQTLATLASAKR